MRSLIVSAVLLVASLAQAGRVDFEIDPLRSFITHTEIWDFFGAGLSPITTTPQFPGSDTAPLYGQVFADLVSGTSISLREGSLVGVSPTGSYAPGPPPSLLTPNANYGIQGSAPFSYLAAIFNLVYDFGTTGPMTLSGNEFDLTGQAMFPKNGRITLTSNLGAETSGFSSLVEFGTLSADIGTWDGTTLTIPIHSTRTVIVSPPLFDYAVTMQFVGQIVATPKVPEPSGIVLSGLGVAGFAAAASRMRRRKA